MSAPGHQTQEDFLLFQFDPSPHLSTFSSLSSVLTTSLSSSITPVSFSFHFYFLPFPIIPPSFPNLPHPFLCVFGKKNDELTSSSYQMTSRTWYQWFDSDDAGLDHFDEIALAKVSLFPTQLPGMEQKPFEH